MKFEGTYRSGIANLCCSTKQGSTVVCKNVGFASVATLIMLKTNTHVNHLSFDF